MIKPSEQYDRKVTEQYLSMGALVARNFANPEVDLGDAARRANGGS